MSITAGCMLGEGRMSGLAVTSQLRSTVVIAASGQFFVFVVAVSDYLDLLGVPLLGIRHSAPS